MHKIRSQSGNRKNFTRDSGASSKFEPFANRRKLVLNRKIAKQQVADALPSDACLRGPRARRAYVKPLTTTATVVPKILKKDVIVTPSKAKTSRSSAPLNDMALLEATALEIEQIRRNASQHAAPTTQNIAASSSQAAHPKDPPPSYEEATRDAIANGMQSLWQKLGQELASSKTSVPEQDPEEDSNSTSSGSEDKPFSSVIVNPDPVASAKSKKREVFMGDDDSNPQLLYGSDYVRNAEEYRFVPIPETWHIQQAPQDPERVNVKLTNQREDGASAPSMPADVYYQKYPSALTDTVGDAFAHLAGKALSLFRSISRTAKTGDDSTNRSPGVSTIPRERASGYRPTDDTNERVATNTSSAK